MWSFENSLILRAESSLKYLGLLVSSCGKGMPGLERSCLALSRQYPILCQADDPRLRWSPCFDRMCEYQRIIGTYVCSLQTTNRHQDPIHTPATCITRSCKSTLEWTPHRHAHSTTSWRAITTVSMCRMGLSPFLVQSSPFAFGTFFPPDSVRFDEFAFCSDVTGERIRPLAGC